MEEAGKQAMLTEIVKAYETAMSGGSVQKEGLRAEIIQALKEGVDPTHIKEDDNTVLTAAFAYNDEELINFIFSYYPSGHLLFSLRDNAFTAGNTPLSLALKKGRYDLAEKLVNEKNCDIDVMIGDSEWTRVHVLHLCAVLVGSFYGEANEKEKKLIELTKAILAKSKNPQEKNYWSETPFDILNREFTKEDFELYQDTRDYFQYYKDRMYSKDEADAGTAMMELPTRIKLLEESIERNQRKQKSEKVAQARKALGEARDKLDELEDKYPKLVLVVKHIAQFEKRASVCPREELEPFLKENHQFEKIGQHYFHREQELFTVDQIKRVHQGAVPEFIRPVRGGVLTRAQNSAYMLVDHVLWHGKRSESFQNILTGRRVNYLHSDEGKRVKEELSALMKSASPRLE